MLFAKLLQYDSVVTCCIGTAFESRLIPGLRSDSESVQERVSQNILHLLNGYCKSVSGDLSLERSRYSRWQDLEQMNINIYQFYIE